MPQTILNEYSYPNEDQDPFYDAIRNFWNAQDVSIWNNKLRSNFIMAGGGTLTWDVGSSLLSWTENFALKHLVSGFLIEYVYGTDGINREINIEDNQIVYGKFSSAITAAQTKNLFVADSLDKNDDYFVLCWRYNDKLYFQNGIIL